MVRGPGDSWSRMRTRIRTCARHDQRSTIYGVVDGQAGDNGVLTFGFSYFDVRQRSPMWGSLTLNQADGSLADFPSSSSTSQDWTYWNTRAYNLFAEYTHTLPADWEAKFTANHLRGEEDTKLLYAYSLSGVLNPDNTGLVGWPYRSDSETGSDILDANLTGRYNAFGRRHEAVLGLSHSKQKNATDTYGAGPNDVPLPAFPYAGDAFAEPAWGARSTGPRGEQQLTRLYAATRLALTDRLKGIGGINAAHLERDGASIYGNGTVLDDSKTDKLSPYVGATYDITPDVLGYVSYSEGRQAADHLRGVRREAGGPRDVCRPLADGHLLLRAEGREIARLRNRGHRPHGLGRKTDRRLCAAQAHRPGRQRHLRMGAPPHLELPGRFTRAAVAETQATPA